MPKPGHVRVTFSGVLGTTPAPLEQWSFGLSLYDSAWESGVPEPTDDAACDAVAAAARSSYVDNINPRMPSDIILTETRVAWLGDGRLVTKRGDGSYVQGINTVTSAGLNSGPLAIPPQAALCVSLDTPRPGARGKGRFFLPAPSLPVAADKLLSSASVTTLAASCVELVRDLNGLEWGDVSVVSSFGFASPVTSLRIGRVLDTLRSRRRDLIEGHIAATV